MKEKLTHLEDYNFIESLKTKNPVPFLKSIIKILDEKEIERLKVFLKDEELVADLLLVFGIISENFKSESIREFLLNYDKNLEKCQRPTYKNERSVVEFFFFARRIFKKNIIPRQKLISKKSMVVDFNVDPDTFNEWLLFFGKEIYIGRRDLNGLESAAIVKDFINVKNLKFEDLSQYHFNSYNRISIAKIIGDLYKSEKTLYRNLSLKTEDIDDLNPENQKFLEWLTKHRVLPFSLAHRYISLLLEKSDGDIKIKSVFEEYMKRNIE
jgi:hypothetical protein